MHFEDLLTLIYGDLDRRPRCGHCGRPLVKVEEHGKKYLFCKHCRDLSEEDKEKEEKIS